MPVKVVVWGENIHEQTVPAVRAIYPDGMHRCIAAGLNEDSRINATTAVLQDPGHGLSDERLAETDVLFWWGHAAHEQVSDCLVDLIQKHVWQGMGLVCLHSAHFSKIFRRMMGTPCALKWREAGEKERLWACNPMHPIAAGVGPYFELENTEMYGEPFSVPEPDETVFISWFEGGEVFRSGMTFSRGNGKIFYFGPGHETYPIYHNENIKFILKNAAKWARCESGRWKDIDRAPNVPVDQSPVPIVARGPHLNHDGRSGLR